ncbi:MAG: WecB/TagA/CpsF family glycosyltransferase [Clostridia bacterium]|nr:WecB/TagA/CpsF family glycosyltransferase [Clostridia bacterium]
MIFRKYFEKIYKKSREDFYKEVEDDLINEKRKFIITANPETIMRAEFEESDLKTAFFSEKSCVVADGVGVLKGAKILDIEIPETILGVSTCEELFKMCDRNEKSLFLFGAKGEVLAKLVARIKRDFPKVNIVGAVDGYVDDKQGVFDEIENKKPDVVLVALGIPAQERLIYSNIDRFDKGIFVGVGGSFDVLSGDKKGAPEFFKKTNLEWLYRITREPKRLKRFFKYNVRYWSLVKKERK